MVIMIVLNKFCSLTSINDNFRKQSLNIKYLLLISQRFTKVFINGYWLGIVREPKDLVDKIKIYRRNGLLPTYLSVSFEVKTKTIYIYCDEGRVTRPLFYKDENNKMSFELPGALKHIQSGDSHWNDFISGFNKKSIEFNPNDYAIYDAKELYGMKDNQIQQFQQFIDKKALLDYVDNNESESSLIALKHEDYLKNPEKFQKSLQMFP